MLVLAQTSFLPLLVIAIVLFFACGTALATALSATAGKMGSQTFARYATAGDIGSAVGPLLGWAAYEFIETPQLVFYLGTFFYGLGLLAARYAFASPKGAAKLAV